MSVDKATVARIAHLARIGVPEHELEALAGELDTILGFVEQLDEVATDDVAPLSSVHDQVLAWREDRVDDGDMRERVFANLPAGEGETGRDDVGDRGTRPL